MLTDDPARGELVALLRDMIAILKMILSRQGKLLPRTWTADDMLRHYPGLTIAQIRRGLTTHANYRGTRGRRMIASLGPVEALDRALEKGWRP